MATLLEQSEAFDSRGNPDGQIHQKIRSAMILKAKDIMDLAKADAGRPLMLPWAEDVLKNSSILKVEEFGNVRRYVFAYHAAKADKAALIALSDTEVQTAVDAYVDTRYNPA